jgi:hypothetical protein
VSVLSYPGSDAVATRLPMNPMNLPGADGARQPPKLLDEVAAKMRVLPFSKRTEQAYVDWIKLQ